MGIPVQTRPVFQFVIGNPVDLQRPQFGNKFHLLPLRERGITDLQVLNDLGAGPEKFHDGLEAHHLL